MITIARSTSDRWVTVRGNHFGRQHGHLLVDRARVNHGRWEVLRVQCEIVKRGVVLVDAVVEFLLVSQFRGEFWVSRNNVAENEFGSLERLVAQGASALFGVVHADVGFNELSVRGIAESK